MSDKRCAAVFSAGIAAIEHLDQMLGIEIEHKTWFGPMHYTEVYGWGRKKNTRWPRLYANRNSIPFACLEDGFIRSYGLGVSGAPLLSVVRDFSGIYYDSTGPSDLETLIREQSSITSTLMADADIAMRAIVSAGVTKYSVGDEFTADDQFLSDGGSRVLVVDQTYGDMSMMYGSPRGDVFQEMLECAVLENPRSTVYLKTHPDVLSGVRRGCFSKKAIKDSGARVLAGDYNPYSVFPYFDRIYTVTSQMGFEALLAGKKVTCFGMPFYAGWGLTDDRVMCERRGVVRTLAEVFANSYLVYTKYLNPETKKAGTIFDVISHVIDKRSAAKGGLA